MVSLEDVTLVQVATWRTFQNAPFSHVTPKIYKTSKQKECNLQNTLYITSVTAKQSLILLQGEDRRLQQHHYIGDLHFFAQTLKKANTAI